MINALLFIYFLLWNLTHFVYLHELELALQLLNRRLKNHSIHVLLSFHAISNLRTGIKGKFFITVVAAKCKV